MDLYVAVSTELAAEPAGPALLVAAGSPGCPGMGFRPAGALRAEPSSLLAHVSLEKFRIAKVYALRLPPGAKVLAWAGELPLLVLWESPHGRRAFLTAELGSSNLPLLPDFPVLVRNLLGWLLPEEPAPLLEVGETLRLPPGYAVLSEAGPVEGLWSPEKPGLYELRRPDGTGYVAVNVPWEASQPPPPWEASPPKQNRAEIASPLWPWVLLALLPLLLGEALLFVGGRG